MDTARIEVKAPRAQPRPTIPSVTEPVQPPVSKECVVCGKTMPLAGKKCTECDSYQSGLRSYLPTGEAVLSVTFVLLTVAGIVIPAVALPFYRASSTTVRVVGAPPSGQTHVILVHASNFGKQPAVVRSGSFDLSPIFLGQADIAVTTLPRSIVPGEQSTMIELSNDGVANPDGHTKKEVADQLCTAKITLTVMVDETKFFGGRKSTKRQDTFDAKLIAPWLRDKLPGLPEVECPKR